MSLRRIAGWMVALAAIAAAIGPARAIPAFARKHKVSCTTCHAPFPRLKPYGEEFAGRGFRMPPGQEPPRAVYDVGDPLLQLPRELPLAVRLDGYAAWNEGAGAEADFEWPYAFKILSGGPLTERISYYFYFIVEEGDVEGLEDAYLQVNSIFDGPVDLLLGQFQVSDPLFKREARLERLDYEIYKVAPGDSRIKLTYDQGLMGLWHAPADVEVVFEIVNGNGLDDPAGSFDRDSNKNLVLRGVRDFGPLRVGLFGYLGKEEGDNGLKNRTSYWGPDLAYGLSDRWQLNLQYLERRDDDPFFVDATGGDLVTRGGFFECLYLPGGSNGRWAFTGLYNHVDSDDREAERESAALSLSYLLARNVRLIVEAGHDLEVSANRASVGLIAAF